MYNDRQIPVWRPGEYSYPRAFGFEPNLMPYLHGDGTVRPCMIVCPGGGYTHVSPAEGELPAKKFYDKGFNCFVFTYTTDILSAEPLLEQPSRDLARAVRFVRANSGRFEIDPERVCLCGFSAAAHVCASVCDYFAEITDANPLYGAVSCRPDAAILSYPVITSGRHAHQGSFRTLLGRDIYERTDAEAAALLDRWSLEKHVSPDTPPCFIWQTASDASVPVENSYLYAEALKEKGILFAHHVFSHGRHGMSVADSEWGAGKIGEPYCLEQIVRTIEAMNAGLISVSEEDRKDLIAQAPENRVPKKDGADPEVMVWPDLAYAFLRYAGIISSE